MYCTVRGNPSIDLTDRIVQRPKAAVDHVDGLGIQARKRDRATVRERDGHKVDGGGAGKSGHCSKAAGRRARELIESSGEAREEQGWARVEQCCKHKYCMYCTVYIGIYSNYTVCIALSLSLYILTYIYIYT